MSRTYSRAEAEEIFRRAAERTRDGGEAMLSREELIEAAREAGLDPDAVHAAAEEVETGLAPPVDPIAEWRDRRKRGFSTHFFVWLAVCGALLGINLLTTPGVLWFAIPTFVWGIGLALHALAVYRAPTQEQQDRVRHRYEKKQVERQRKLDRERQKLEALRQEADRARTKKTRREDRARREDVAAQFEAAVEEGVTALMDAAARTLTEVARKSRPSPKRETDFDRFVARQKGQRVPERVEVEGPRERIDPEGAPDEFEDLDEAPARQRRR